MDQVWGRYLCQMLGIFLMELAYHNESLYVLTEIKEAIYSDGSFNVRILCVFCCRNPRHREEGECQLQCSLRDSVGTVDLECCDVPSQKIWQKHVIHPGGSGQRRGMHSCLHKSLVAHNLETRFVPKTTLPVQQHHATTSTRGHF